jgi:hypothetical protein
MPAAGFDSDRRPASTGDCAVTKASLVIVSTVIWQFILSGLGRVHVSRYFQSRINQAFGRPYWYWYQFARLLVAALLFADAHSTA